MNSIDISHTEEIYSVSQLNRDVRLLLENGFPSIWVEGEISNLAMPSSGHWYFGLKDADAQVKCAMFKPHNRKLSFTLRDGMHVFLKARVSLYEGRGDFQLIVEHLEEAGEGKLRQAFEALKKRLAEAGLFAEARKKPLPVFPTCIGVVTSPTGAAIRDILSVLKRRYPSAAVIIYPTLVQGDTAAPAIVKAIAAANARKECDVLIIARGGGSLEDLWPFNDENVAYAISKSQLPTISGVGHEIDFTIADFVADLRAPTPSVAAEIATPDRAELLEMLAQQSMQLIRVMRHKLKNWQQHISWVEKHLQQQHPKRKLAEQVQKLDFYEATLIRLQTKLMADAKSTLQTLKTILMSATPQHRIANLRHQLTVEQQRLQHDIQKILQQKKLLLSNAATKLDVLSPLATLHRGFAIATIKEGKTLLQTTGQVQFGDKIQVRLQHGILGCSVEDIKNA